MRRWFISLVFILLLVSVAVWLFNSPRRASPCQLTAAILGTTNNGSAPTQVTLRIVNVGERSAELLPAYGVETRPPKVDPTMMGAFSSIITKLTPGQACTNTIALPPLTGRSWRVSITYLEVRSAPKDFAHYWLMQAGLAKRDQAGFVGYSDWVN